MANEKQKNTNDELLLGRRRLLGAGLVGLGVAAVGVASPLFAGTASAATKRASKRSIVHAPDQTAGEELQATADLLAADTVPGDIAWSGPQGWWAWCSKCQGLFFADNETRGVCPAGGTHGDETSYFYGLIYDVDSSISNYPQPNWGWCNKCQGGFYAGHSGSVCPAGGSHNNAGFNYSLYYRVANNPSDGIQAGWAWCNKCQGSFFTGHSHGVCPAGGSHNNAGYNYDMMFAVSYDITF